MFGGGARERIRFATLYGALDMRFYLISAVR